MYQDHITAFRETGYTVVSGLFSPEEVANYIAHYMALRAQGRHPGDFAGVDLGSTDPLVRFPRMIHMHRWDALSKDWLLDPRLIGLMTALLGDAPLAVQTMLYFKPPGARGQALHQDQFYLQAKPGDCVAAWMALDDTDEENGCMRIVPRSQDWPLLCTEKADTTRSFTDVTVPLPEGVIADPVRMKAGDVLFFTGHVIHGSYPNTSTTRFRRSLIGHYLTAQAEEVVDFYQPALRPDGTEVWLAHSKKGGPCGVWVDQDGTPVIEWTS